ncbi:hypothetical protein DEO23_14085 [Brachybacterium endophyticum]|uniref:Uncharacterized protein n=1 Tax=Brachybacterium endophyticum TaxID=2182385 RepID=A0A2U2RHI5_9MICO|nr:hypothetical protein DEO23_14085 [Brachybacterium endophyticum]
MPAKKRRSLKPSQFGLPGSRRYPVDTKARARNAKARAAQQRKAGNLSKSSQSKINAKANKRLRRKG